MTNAAAAGKRPPGSFRGHQRARTGRAGRAAGPTSRCRGPSRKSNGTPFPSSTPPWSGQLNWTAPDHAADQPWRLRHQCAGDQHHHGQRRASSRASPPARRWLLNFNNSHQSWNRLTIGVQPVHRLQPGAHRHAAAAARLRRGPEPPLHPHRRQRTQRSPACCSSSSSSPPSTA